LLLAFFKARHIFNMSPLEKRVRPDQGTKILINQHFLKIKPL